MSVSDGRAALSEMARCEVVSISACDHRDNGAGTPAQFNRRGFEARISQKFAERTADIVEAQRSSGAVADDGVSPAAWMGGS